MDYSVLRADIIDSRPDIDIKAVDAAYEFAKEHHEGQKRYSGEPYIMHPVAATGILLRFNPDLLTIQACLLHDVTEDTDATLEDLEAEFGKEVATLVQGLEKLAVVKIREHGFQEEKWKKMFLAMSKDIRIVFIKLSDRFHNMQTLEHVPVHKRERIARESLVVHAGIASRMGMYKIKSELEDLCFQYLYPEDFIELSEKLAANRDRSKECMDYATSQVEQLLMREGVNLYKVQGRMKHLWSIYQKMQNKDEVDLNEIYDVFAVRVILDDEENVSHLYSVLGVLYNEFIPLQDRFKDYVAVPKPNGYRSLHITVVGLGGDLYEEPTEIQIRTRSMHKEAEMGLAAHFAYKEGPNTVPVDRDRHFALHNSLKKIHSIVERNPDVEGIITDWVERYQSLTQEDRRNVEATLLEHGLPEEDLDNIQKGRSQERLSLKPNIDEQLAWLRGLAEADDVESRLDLDLFPDKIFVLTPGRDVVQLSKGSTPIDFAYAVHTDVGHKMFNAKVNGRIVPLDYELKNGDLVSVGTRGNAKPNRYWLSIAKTNSAKSKIKNWFNKQDKESNIIAGREMLNHKMHTIGQPSLDDKLTLLKEYAGKKRSYSEREQILESIGLGSTSVAQIVKTLFPDLRSEKDEPRKKEVDIDELEWSEKVLITGEEDLPVIFSMCCKPKPPNPIIGYVNRGHAIRVHRQSCQELAGLEGDRFVSAHWGKKS